jgi:hypothetical protein
MQHLTTSDTAFNSAHAKEGFAETILVTEKWESNVVIVAIDKGEV